MLANMQPTLSAMIVSFRPAHIQISCHHDVTVSRTYLSHVPPMLPQISASILFVLIRPETMILIRLYTSQETAPVGLDRKLTRSHRRFTTKRTASAPASPCTSETALLSSFPRRLLDDLLAPRCRHSAPPGMSWDTQSGALPMLCRFHGLSNAQRHWPAAGLELKTWKTSDKRRMQPTDDAASFPRPGRRQTAGIT